MNFLLLHFIIVYRIFSFVFFIRNITQYKIFFVKFHFIVKINLVQFFWIKKKKKIRIELHLTRIGHIFLNSISICRIFSYIFFFSQKIILYPCYVFSISAILYTKNIYFILLKLTLNYLLHASQLNFFA